MVACIESGYWSSTVFYCVFALKCHPIVDIYKKESIILNIYGQRFHGRRRYKADTANVVPFCGSYGPYSPQCILPTARSEADLRQKASLATLPERPPLPPFSSLPYPLIPFPPLP